MASSSDRETGNDYAQQGFDPDERRGTAAIDSAAIAATMPRVEVLLIVIMRGLQVRT